MKNEDNEFHKLEQLILRTALLVILVLTLVRIILPEVFAVKDMILNKESIENKIDH